MCPSTHAYTTQHYIAKLYDVENKLARSSNIKEFKIYRDDDRNLAIDVVAKQPFIDNHLEYDLNELANMAVTVQHFKKSIIRVRSIHHQVLLHKEYVKLHM